MEDEGERGRDGTGQTPLDYAGPSTPARRPSRLVVINAWLGAIAIAAVLIASALPALNRGQPPTNRVACASNLRQIGTAMMMYANANGGAFPDSFATLLRNEDITSFVFACPSSNDTPSIAPTKEEQIADLAKPGHLSYVYTAKGLNNMAPTTAVLAYEPLGNHRVAGMNVLFGDGHVDFVASPTAQWIINEINAGFNPPRRTPRVKAGDAASVSPEVPTTKTK